MKTVYTNNSTWRGNFFMFCCALFLLCSTTVVNAQTTYGPYAMNTPLSFSAFDNTYNGTFTTMAASPIAVSGVAGSSVIDISVNVAINHTWVGDLIIKLQSPNGSILTLVSNPGNAETIDNGTGGVGTNADWLGQTLTFTDAGVTDAETMNVPFAGTYFPNAGATASVGSFAALFGGTMNGNWTLYIGDQATGDLGTLNSWSISIVTASPSFTISKVVAQEDGNGDCSDDLLPVTNNINVNSGDGVCYWYVADNTGDVAFDLIDFVDDQLLPGGLFGAAGFDLPVASALAIPWDVNPTVINATVTNIADITYYSSTLGLSAGPVTDQATVNVVAQAANDNVCNASPLSFGLNGPVNTASATAQVGEPAPPAGSNGLSTCESSDGWCAGDLAVQNSVWYTFVAPASGSVTINTDGSYDTQVAVYEAASCNAILSGGATLLGANDDNPTYIFTEFSSDLFVQCLTPGQTYFVQIDGYQGDSGSLYVELTDNGGVAVSATISGGGVSCDGADVTLQVDFTGTGPWDLDVLINGVIPQNFPGIVDNPAFFVINQAASITIASVTDLATGCTGDGAGVAVVTVGTAPVADFTWAQTQGTLNVGFTNTGSGGPTWVWDFNGDAVTDATTQNGSYTYPGSGVYDAYLTVTNACGSDQATQSITVVPVNDLCAGAIAVSCDDLVTGDTEFATANDAPTGTFTISEGIWYVLAGSDLDVTAATCGGASWDTEIIVMEGACGSLTYVDNDDDGCGTQSTVSWFANAGTDYYIYVGDYSSTTGTGGNSGVFDLSVICTLPPTPPANDDVCDAISLSLGLNGPFSNLEATVEVGEPLPPIGTGANSCQSQDGWCDFENGLDNSVWFSFVAPASGNVIVNTDGGDFDTQVGVYTAASCSAVLSSATLIGANDDNPNYITTQFSSELVLCGLNPGTVYYVQVDGYNADAGDIYVTLSEFLTSAFSSSATNLDVVFTDASTSDGGITDWAWDFGDGGTSTSQNPSHSYPAGGTYLVCLTVTDINGCTATTCQNVTVVDITISIAEAVENGMEVYPNPSNGQFVVTIRGVEADVQIIVMDLTGRQVYNEGANVNASFRKELNLNVAKGTYVLQISTLEGSVNRKIIID